MIRDLSPKEALTASENAGLSTPASRPGFVTGLAAVAFAASAGVVVLLDWHSANAFDTGGSDQQGKMCAQEAVVLPPPVPPNDGQCDICDDPPRCLLCLTAGEPDAETCETQQGGAPGQWNHAQCWPVPNPGDCGVSCLVPQILFTMNCVPDDPQNPTTCDCKISYSGYNPYNYTSVTFCDACPGT
jgi:hypothetical protein